MFLISVLPSKRADKKLTATLCPCKIKSECKGKNYKTIHFGQKGSTTFISGATDKQRDAYIARHAKTEDWTDPLTAGFWSRWALWEKRTLQDALKFLKLKFKL